MYATWNSRPRPTNLCSPSSRRVSLDPLPAYDGAETSISSTQSISMYPCTSLNTTHAISQDIPVGVYVSPESTHNHNHNHNHDHNLNIAHGIINDISDSPRSSHTLSQTSNFLMSNPTPNLVPNLSYSASDFVSLSIDEKKRVVRVLVECTSFSVNDLRKLATVHHGISARHLNKTQTTTSELRSEFSVHSCSSVCLVRIEHAEQAARLLKLRNYTSLTPTVSPRKRKPVSSYTPQANKKQRTSLYNTGHNAHDPSSTSDIIIPTSQTTTVNEFENADWLEILPMSENLQLLQESYSAGGNAAIKQIECSFCGNLETIDGITSIPCSNLDISLLETAVQDLRLKSNQPSIQPFCPANAEQFHDNVSHLGMPSSTVVDADHVDTTYKMRKLNAISRLKSGTEPPFIKFPSGSVPLPTRNNPKLFGYLWPTLFPYGSGPNCRFQIIITLRAYKHNMSLSWDFRLVSIKVLGKKHESLALSPSKAVQKRKPVFLSDAQSAAKRPKLT
ncbi:hypothetical protein K435DRAFT_971853 [Dendrothele bispora CBS 962.96]|uniref:Uncharacterized protein n=1 Tax=Dendrothele bispora (strain CBS 962.96) TaxID=1314807 RepID=A0A4S8L2M3_DENBC|nr:hypothetical protein K435DRAFT_971853 [Dendrothele bispora CBS 962.96]